MEVADEIWKRRRPRKTLAVRTRTEKDAKLGSRAESDARLAEDASAYDAKGVVSSAVYRIPGRFADPDEFISFLSASFPPLVGSKASLSEIARRIQFAARRTPAMRGDLALLSAELQKNWFELQKPFRKRMDSFQGKARSVLARLGFKYAPPPVYVVEAFPAPFDAMNFDALTIDKFDEADFGIPPGIYFLRSQLIPDLAIHTYAHEMIHHLISEHTKERFLARGIEEGFCEFFGALFLDGTVRGLGLAEAVHRNSMFSYPVDHFWQNYVSSTRQVHLMYSSIGMPGILKIIRRGRAYLKELEDAFLQGRWRELMPRGFFPPDSNEFQEMMDRLFWGFNPNYVVSLEMYEVASDLRPGVTLEKLARKTGKSVSKLRELLKRYQEEHFLLLVSGNRIEFCDVPMYLEAGALRYSLKSQKNLNRPQ